MATLRLAIDSKGAMDGARGFVDATNVVKSSASSVMSTLTKLAAMAGVSLSFGYAVKEAMGAEQSYRKLAASLGLVGAATKENLAILSSYALATQRKTVYSHEEIENQMAYLGNLGVHTTRLKDATNAAIGLASAYKMDLESAIFLVGKAWNGETGMLARRGIMIDQVGSAQDKFNRLVQVGTGYMSLSYDDTRSATGAFKQLKIEVGEVAETIGMAFLPMLKDAAILTKTWLIDSQPQVERWAGLTANAAKLAGASLYDFASFMKSDFSTSVSFGLDISSDLFKAWGQDLLLIFEKIFGDITINIPVWIERSSAMGLDRAKLKNQYWNELNQKSKDSLGLYDMSKSAEYKAQAAKMADEMVAYSQEYGVYDIAFPTKETQSWKSVFKEMGANHKTMIENMKKDIGTLPKEWKDKFSGNLSEWEKKNAEINTQYQNAIQAKALNDFYGTSSGSHANIPALTAGTNERANMGDIDAQKKVDDMYRSLEDERKLIGLTAEARERKAETIKLERIYTDELGYSIEKATDYAKDFDDEMKQLQQLQKLQNLADDIGTSFGNSFEDMAFGAKSAGEAMRAFALDVAHLVFKMMVTIPIAQALSSALMSMGIGFGGGGTSAPGEATGPHVMALGGVFADGRLQRFAGGGIFDRPTLFPMANGAGLMGEAGPEAIMPLRRGNDGRLGVSASGGGSMSVQTVINIENKSSQPVKATIGQQSFDGRKYVTGIVLEDFNTNGPIARGMNSRR